MRSAASEGEKPIKLKSSCRLEQPVPRSCSFSSVLVADDCMHSMAASANDGP